MIRKIVPATDILTRNGKLIDSVLNYLMDFLYLSKIDKRFVHYTK